ncbi:MAG: tRNA dihydrouridine synthase DusB [Bdellovibrionales bacterium]|nr:tRNA dihydrouridine synthase DusB [Bdellovibrionales bacterium]
MAVDLSAELKRNPFVLAPMAGITDRAFRTVMRELDCGPVVTELVSAHGIEYASPKTLQLMEFDENQHPVGIQIFGETPEVLARAAQVCQARGADFVDLNFGCPVPKVVKKGAGSAILRDLNAVTAVFKAVKAAVEVPVTVKIRTGWDHESRNAAEVARIAQEEGLAWVAIHGRTRAAGYSGQADWDYIADVKAKSKIPILGNGDIATAQQAVQRMSETGVDGVMIGRGCLKNPWIFKQAMGLRQTGAVPAVDKDFGLLFERLHQAFQQVAQGEKTDRFVMLQIKKFASWYSTGYPGASQFRKTIFQHESLEATLGAVFDYFRSIASVVQADTSHEAFLMGGHG